MTEPLSKSKRQPIDEIQQWCLKNPIPSILIGAAIIFVGLIIGDAFEFPDPMLKLNFIERVHWSYVFSHLFIILGEAIIVMFFLHIFIEKTNTKAHIDHSIVVLKNIEKLSSEILENKKNEIDKVFGGLIDKFIEEADKTTAALKLDLFAAILQDKMPVEIVKLILENNFFSTNILRRNVKICYIFKGQVDDILLIEQRISFDMEYISGQDETIDYNMPFSLGDTPLAKYEFVEAGYRRITGKRGGNEYIKFKETPHFIREEFGLNKEKDTFELKSPIQLIKNESINVQQILNAKYNIGAKGTVDFYYVKNHSVGVTIEFDIPNEYEINVYPTFPESYLPEANVIGTKTTYENIAFLVPGQGYGFSIMKQ